MLALPANRCEWHAGKKPEADKDYKPKGLGTPNKRSAPSPAAKHARKKGSAAASSDDEASSEDISSEDEPSDESMLDSDEEDLEVDLDNDSEEDSADENVAGDLPNSAQD